MKKRELLKNLEDMNDWLKGKTKERPLVEPTKIIDAAMNAIAKANTKRVDSILKKFND